jgi:hypothetical protein
MFEAQQLVFYTCGRPVHMGALSAPTSMADRRIRRGSLQVHLDYAFDRLRQSKLAF